jgi:hypothetical protein
MATLKRNGHRNLQRDRAPVPHSDLQDAEEVPVGMSADWRQHLKRAGRRGGKRNSKLQQQHRKGKAVRAMLHAKYPGDPRWKIEKP